MLYFNYTVLERISGLTTLNGSPAGAVLSQGDEKMAKGIFSVKRFLRTFKPGDTFWFMEWFNYAPVGIEGPCTILHIVPETNPKFTDPSFTKIVTDKGERLVGDLTNQDHGVFRDEESARVYFLKRRYRYATNPRLIAEIEEQKEVDRMFSQIFRERF